MVSDGQIKPIP